MSINIFIVSLSTKTKKTSCEVLSRRVWSFSNFKNDFVFSKKTDTCFEVWKSNRFTPHSNFVCEKKLFKNYIMVLLWSEILILERNPFIRKHFSRISRMPKVVKNLLRRLSSADWNGKCKSDYFFSFHKKYTSEVIQTTRITEILKK